MCDLATDPDAIIGTDFLKKMNANVNLEGGRFCLKKVGSVDHAPLGGGQCGTHWTADGAALSLLPRRRPWQQTYCWIGCKKQEERQAKRTETISPEI
jgi:hypothetical protein